MASETPDVRRGDIVLSLDGEPARAWLERELAYFSGSDRWRRHRALTHPLRGFGRGQPGSLAQLRLLRDDREVEVEVRREAEEVPEEPRPAEFEEVAEGILYVDLARAEFAAIDARSDELAAARGVVFDLRGYPKDRRVISHLIDEPVQGFQGLVPWIIYPDRERIVGWDDRFRWTLEPREPRFHGEVVFLTDARAISFAESVLSMVEAYSLAEIVGQATAGANGTVNPFSLPGSYIVGWTGLKVLKEDGSQHHLVGIAPTIPVQRTIAAVRAGRDEYLEKALEIIQSRIGTR